MKRISSRFMDQSISRKLFIGYLSLLIVIVLISAVTLSSLQRLNSINSSLINTYVPLIDRTEKMIDALLNQELYARRYLLLQSQDFLALFWEKSTEFDNLLELVTALPEYDASKVNDIDRLHREYNRMFIKGFKYTGNPSSKEATQFEADIRKKQEELIALIKEISLNARQIQHDKTLLTSDVGMTAFKVTAILCLVGIFMSFISSFVITKSIAEPIKKLKNATKEIAEGKFDLAPHVKSKDELGDLSDSFLDMAQRLKRLEEIHLDASPLTRLPGNRVIETILQKRLESSIPIAFCHVDMDNFKAYNDRYGYAKGSEVIKATAEIIERNLKNTGSTDDFLGHIGGDDFVIITTPTRYVDICKVILDDFDRNISKYYSQEDLKKGYIPGKTRMGSEEHFPIMTLSIAVVTNTARTLSNPIEVGEIAAELKEYAKSLPGSVYVVDRRRHEAKADAYIEENVINFPQKAKGNEQ